VPALAGTIGITVMYSAVTGYPMDIAVWRPVMSIALLVGVFLPLLEAGVQLVRKATDAQAAGICIFASAVVNPVFGWSLTMLLDNNGLIGEPERGRQLSVVDRLLIPGLAFGICTAAMATVGMLPGIPALVPAFR
jgi:hypothetical protein